MTDQNGEYKHVIILTSLSTYSQFRVFSEKYTHAVRGTLQMGRSELQHRISDLYVQLVKG